MTEPTIRDVPLVPPPTGLATTLGWGVLFVLLIWSWEGADMRPLALFKDSANMAVFARDFFPPNFQDWRVYLAGNGHHRPHRGLGHGAGGDLRHPLRPAVGREPRARSGSTSRCGA